MTTENGYGFTNGLLLGATIGAMAALLFAPKSGRETRSDLARETERLKERASLAANEIRTKGAEVMRKGSRSAEAGAERIREASSEYLESAEAALRSE